MPPDPAVVTDEEELNEEDLISPTFPKDVPGTVEEIPRDPDHDNSGEDGSDEQPLSHFIRHTKRARNQDPDTLYGKRCYQSRAQHMKYQMLPKKN